MKSIKCIGVVAVGLLLWQANPQLFAAENYSAITRFNAFRLSPPKPAVLPVVIQPALPKVSLQGLATLLGAQALLNIQTKTPSAVAEISCVLGEGQSRDGVEVLRIDMDTGTVWLMNQGDPQTLTLNR